MRNVFKTLLKEEIFLLFDVKCFLFHFSVDISRGVAHRNSFTVCLLGSAGLVTPIKHSPAHEY